MSSRALQEMRKRNTEYEVRMGMKIEMNADEKDLGLE